MRFRVTLAAIAAFVLPATARAQAPALVWGPAPAVFPAGAKMAVLQGDPSQTAMFTVRLEMPDGYRIPPHFHPTDEHVTVISGTFLVGMGDAIDAAHAITLPAGGSSPRVRTCIIGAWRGDGPSSRSTRWGRSR
jgi:hypothetical protein